MASIAITSSYRLLIAWLIFPIYLRKCNKVEDMEASEYRKKRREGPYQTLSLLFPKIK